jgi:hypothetical protein
MENMITNHVSSRLHPDLLNAFHHPYAYASLHGIPVALQSPSVFWGSSQAARTECREQ